MSKQINIGGRIHSTEVGNVSVGANEVLDDTKGKKQNVINADVDAELLRLDQSKQNNLTFDNTPTENSNNPVKSSGVYAADKALSDAIEAILLLIPSAATALNQLADKAFVNSSVSTATATFRGTYNVVTDLELAYDATHEQIATKLGQVIATADNNDYAFVQVPVSATSMDIRRTERYKFNGTVWGYEYDLNTSGFTAAQWEAINSAITAALVQKLSALPTAQELAAALLGKQDVLTFDNAPTSGSSNPVKSGGVYTAVNDEKVARENADTGLGNRITSIENVIPSAASSSNKLVDNSAMSDAVGVVTALIGQMDATFNLTTTDGHITLHVTQENGVITSVQVQSSDIASAAALTLVTNRVTKAEGDITSLAGRVSTNETDIANLQQLYNNLQQSNPEPVTALPETGQQQGVIYRLAGTTSYSDYMWNGSTWVLMATYNNAIDPRPKKASQNLVTSGGVFDNMGALDVSELNATENPHTLAQYNDLSAALAAIPTDYQKGGMSIKFVQSSDNKYVRYNLLADSFTTDTTQWAVDNAGVYMNNPEFIEVKTDVDGKILEARKPNGTKVEFADLEVKGEIINQGKSLIDADFASSVEVVDSTEWLSITTDSEGKILGGRKVDGTVIENCNVVFKGRIEGVATQEEVNNLDNRVDALESNENVKNTIKVTLNNTTKRIEIRSALSPTYDIVNSMYWHNDDSLQNNPCLNFGGSTIIDSDSNEILINNEGDNICASGTGISYDWIGGNHGINLLAKCTSSSHGKTYVDIGSKWTNGSKIFVLVYIYDNDNLGFIPMYEEDDGIYIFYTSGNVPSENSTLTSVEGATHTADISITTVSLNMWKPSENIIKREFVLDGKKLTESGVYYGNTLNCLEIYEVYDPASYLDTLITNVGTLTSNPLPRDYKDTLRTIIRYSNDYRFSKGGTNVLLIDWMPMQKLKLEEVFPLNVKEMKVSALGGSQLKYYLPKALPLTVSGTTYDFRVPATYNPSGDLRWTSTYWENPALPPDRAIMFITNGSNKRLIGLHHGYIFDQGIASGNNRKDYVNDWWVHNTTSYSGALSKQKLGNELSQYSHYGMVCYRKYEDYTDNLNGLISLSQFEVNGEYYVYADFEASGNYNISIPAEWCGKKYTVFEKSNNVELECSLTQSLMLVKVTTNNPMYGYIVLGIKRNND